MQINIGETWCGMENRWELEQRAEVTEMVVDQKGDGGGFFSYSLIHHSSLVS